MHAGFDLEVAATQLPYYAALGVSHLTCRRSPPRCPGLRMATMASTRPASIRNWAAKKPSGNWPQRRAHGMGLILDIVPNHLAASPHSHWWSDVLMHERVRTQIGLTSTGEAPGCEGRLWLPVLDRPLHDAVRDGLVRVVVDKARPVLRHHGLALPLSPRSHPLDPRSGRRAERCKPRR